MRLNPCDRGISAGLGNGRRPLVAQAVLIVGALAAAILAPPREGMMLVVPIASARPGITARWAMTAGAALVAPGPVAGSLIIWGDRKRLAPAALRHASLLMAAPPAACGGKR